MTYGLTTPEVDEFGGVVSALREWQDEASPFQLHPGDLGWCGRLGAQATAAAVRVWGRQGRTLAIGLLDSTEVLRLTVAPSVWADEELARAVVADVSDPRCGVLPAGKVSVETPNGTCVQRVLAGADWSAGESWTPLRRDLSGPVEGVNLIVDVVGSDTALDYSSVINSAFDTTKCTVERWRAMAAEDAYADARCLLGRNAQGAAVAGVTVWAAGPGKPGLIEPMGVHVEHRGRGYGRGICLAAAAHLRDMGSASALVCTPSRFTAAVSTYLAAGFTRLPERVDRTRPG